MEGTVPKVSVCVITYNQAKYIKQCIESLITQDCDFDYEIIVSDDCSTDNTREILEHLYHQYPERYVYLYMKRILGLLKIIFSCMNRRKASILHMLMVMTTIFQIN